MIKFSKKMLALVMSMLMIFSFMAVSASAESESTAPDSGVTETTPVTIQIPEPVWVFEQETMSFFVEKPQNIHYPEDGSTYYPVEITVEPEAELIKNEDGSYIIENVELGKEYTITAAIVDETNTVTGSSSVTVAPVINVPGTADVSTFNAEDRTITVEKIDSIIIDGAEYAVVAAIEPATSNMYLEDGSRLFYNLEYGKTYTVKALVQPGADSEIFYSEDNFTVTVNNKQDAPSNPVPTNITATTITINASAGCEYTINTTPAETKKSEGNTAVVFEGLAPETTYTITAQKPATEGYYASDEASITVTTKIAGREDVPTIALEDKSNTSITVTAVDGAEYKLNDGAWQSSNVFAGLKADTQYSIYARYEYDAAKQDPSAVSEALVVKTNAVANYEADEAKIAFSGDDGAYANTEISFTVSGDGPADMTKAVYGDTRIVPVAYEVVCGEDTIKELTYFENPNKVTQKGSFTPAETYAEKNVTVKVTFRTEEFKGADWVEVADEEIEKDFTISVGRVDGPMTKVTEFFEMIANFLFNTLPAFLAQAMQSDVWGALLKALGQLGGAMG